MIVYLGWARRSDNLKFDIVMTGAADASEKAEVFPAGVSSVATAWSGSTPARATTRGNGNKRPDASATGLAAGFLAGVWSSLLRVSKTLRLNSLSREFLSAIDRISIKTGFSR
jgi:hypothetical protein